MNAHSRRRLYVAVAAGVAGILALAGCTSTSNSSGSTAQDSKSQVVIWTDATRQPAFEAYKKAHPDANVKIETFDASALLTKIQLFNRAGKGWPDAVFTGDPNQVAALESPLYNYAAPLDDLVSSDTLKNYGTANAGCVINGKTYCLTNDIAQTVLWYNKSLMEQFGYQLPKTWDDYKALGEKVAAEHPGYIIGAFSSFSYYDLFLSSGCPTQEVVDKQVAHIDLKDPACSRIADVFDPLLANGSVSRSGPFDPPLKKLAQENKILMLPGASWYGDVAFASKDLYNYPDGQIAAASYPTWAGDSAPKTASAGGGIFLVSKHSKNLKGAADAITFAATNTDVQAASVTYPAYAPAAKAWCDKKATGTFYAENPCPVLKEAAADINTKSATPVIYAPGAIFNTTVVAKVTGGGKVEDGFADFQSQLSQIANQSGYAVK